MTNEEEVKKYLKDGKLTLKSEDIDRVELELYKANIYLKNGKKLSIAIAVEYGDFFAYEGEWIDDLMRCKEDK